MAGSSYVYTVTLNSGQAISGLSAMQGALQATADKAHGLTGVFDKLGRAAFAFSNIQDSIQKLTGALDDMAEPGLRLNAAMHSLSAVSGVTGKNLQQIEGYARQAAKTFGGSAADSVEAYQLVLSQLGPHIAQVPEALAAMGDSIKVTSKLMGNDTAAAAEVLTTALNQYQVSLDDPIKASEEMARMMNVMAAAGQAGSAELPTIKEALKQCGMMAKTAGVSFEEANAAIQMLDKAGKKGSEGGVALRNVMSTLSQGRFLPKDVQEELSAAGVSIERLGDKSLSLTDRLRGLTPIMNDSALMSKLFGRENAAAATALMAAIDPIDELTAAISGTNSATEQAGIIMESDVEKMSRFQAKIDDVKIRLYGLYSGILPYVKGLGSAMQLTANIGMTANAMHILSEMSLAKSIAHRTAVVWRAARATTAASGSLGLFSGVAVVAKVACHALAAGFKAIGKAIYSIPIIGWVAAGIALLIKGFKLLWDKCEGFRRLLFGVWESTKAVFHNIGVAFGMVWDNGLKPVFQGIGGAFQKLWNGVKSICNGIKNLFVGLKNTVVNVFARVIEPIRGILEKLKGVFRTAFDRIVEWMSRPFKWIQKLWNKVFKNDKFEDIGEAYKSGAQKGSESWKKDHPDAAAPTASEVQQAGGTAAMATSGSMQQAATAKGTSATVDLANVKASGDYAAIAARLSPKSFAGLGGGNTLSAPAIPTPEAMTEPAVPALPSFLEEPQDETLPLLRQIANNVSKIAAGITIAAMPAMQLAAQPVWPMPGTPASITVAPVNPVKPEQAQGDDAARTVRFDRFCEKVEINVPAGTTRDQVDVILNELMRRINDAVE